MLGLVLRLTKTKTKNESQVAKKAKGNVLASFHIQLAGPFEAHKDVKAFVNNQMSGLKQKKIFFVNFLC